MMPKLPQAIRQAGGRRVSGQVVRQEIVDHEAVASGRRILRATVLLTPMNPRKIAIKPEGQREWKWWTATSVSRLELGWRVLPDADDHIQYEVMTQADWSQAGFYAYDFVEKPRGQ